YACARFTYEMASVPYNALLPSVAREGGVGGVSGFGVALGYLGNVVALALLKLFHVESRGATYLFAAVLFLLFTFPLQFLVRQPPPVRPGRVTWRDIAKAFAPTGAALRRQFRRKAMRNYLLGTLLVCDSINTVLVQIARFAGHEAGLD